MLLKTQVAVNSVPSSLTRTGSSSQNLGDEQSEVSVSTKSEDSLAELRDKLDKLQQQVRQPFAPRSGPTPPKYCAFCQTETYFLKDCWRKPPRGHCFECLRFGCRRGNPTCPGTAARPSSTRQYQSPRSRNQTPPIVNASSVNNTSELGGTADVSVRNPTA
ncbi:hypothetical protein Pmani_005067 [Petrolisthes manimaculis]|uniref:Uncharacterized protein n=1 Tax=Petrolisthes manimaculis TaxID=1843537 RepID=A0AAE1UHT3_9EUCA|nr:hypothetical protein Pmani_005067 [Petrolisthes manimaculis]